MDAGMDPYLLGFKNWPLLFWMEGLRWQIDWQAEMYIAISIYVYYYFFRNQRNTKCSCYNLYILKDSNIIENDKTFQI